MVGLEWEVLVDVSAGYTFVAFKSHRGSRVSRADGAGESSEPRDHSPMYLESAPKGELVSVNGSARYRRYLDIVMRHGRATAEKPSRWLAVGVYCSEGCRFDCVAL